MPSFPMWTPALLTTELQTGKRDEEVPYRETPAGLKDARDPDEASRYDLGTAGAMLPIPIVAPVYPDEPVGTARAARHPGGIGLLRRWSPEWDERNTGAHGEITAGAASPGGDQLPYETRGNSFRLEPQPWDTAAYYGAFTTGQAN